MGERFTDTFHCRSHVHCQTCRSLDAGKPWRMAMARRFAVPEGVPDWTCPDGLPWNAQESDVPDNVRVREKKPCGCGKAGTPRHRRPPTRPSCLECVDKHLGAAWVLITEHRNGYPHRLLAIGHLHEAEEESQAWPELAEEIRKARKAFQATGNAPDFDHLAQLLPNSAEAHGQAGPLPLECTPSKQIELVHRRLLTMDEKQAKAIAEALGGDTWQSGGGVCLVLLRRPDGVLVVISDEAVCEYEDEEAFEDARARVSIPLH